MNKKEFFQNIKKSKKSISSIDDDSMRSNDSIMFDRLNNSNLSLGVKNDFTISKDFDAELLDYLSKEGTLVLNFFAIDPDTTTYAYVSDGSNYLWQCPTNATTGAFTNGSCIQNANSTSFFGSTYSSTFATFSGSTYVYVADHTSNLWRCPINTATGSISAGCTALTASFANTSSVSFYTASGTTYA